MDKIPIHVNGPATAGRFNDSKRHGEKLKKNKLKLISIVVGAVIVVAVIVLGSLFFYNSSTGSTIDNGEYQAVFFTNGQVYFGKLHTLNGEYMKLTDVFYLQAKTTTSSTGVQTAANSGTSDVQLIKLGSEIHGPEDSMIISKNQILFFENLKNNSKVSSSIAKYLKK